MSNMTFHALMMILIVACTTMYQHFDMVSPMLTLFLCMMYRLVIAVEKTK